MSEQFKAALWRALIIGALSAISTALTTWGSLPTHEHGMLPEELKTLIVATGTAFLAPVLARFGGEGAYDTRRANAGDVRPGDVKAKTA